MALQNSIRVLRNVLPWHSPARSAATLESGNQAVGDFRHTMTRQRFREQEPGGDNPGRRGFEGTSPLQDQRAFMQRGSFAATRAARRRINRQARGASHSVIGASK
jgi:hypothetical protein